MQFYVLEILMVKKSLLLASLLFAAPTLFAAGSLSTLKYGLTSIDNDDGFDFSKHSFRADAMFDQGSIIKPRVGFGYISIDESKAEGGVSGALQFDVEGVYEVESRYLLTPYLFAGMGYEYVMDSRPNFDSQFFIDGGMGLRYPLPNSINLVTELKAMHMLKSNSNQDAEFAFYIGVGIPFGRTVSPQDSDRDGVYDYADMCPNSPLGSQVDLSGCPPKQTTLAVDSDGDTIPDSRDICPNTPPGVGVNDRGCPVRASVQAKAFHGVEPTMLGDSVVTSTPVVGEVIGEVVTTGTTSEVLGEVISEVPAKVPAVAAIDSDHDGVKDSLDQCANTPKGFTVNSIGCAVKKNLDVRFEPNSFNVTPASKSAIQAFAKFLKRYPNANVKIVGYTDTSGNRARNRLISEKRAQRVKQLLVGYGISASRMTAIGKGDLNPIATNDTTEGREQNRRVEVEIR